MRKLLALLVLINLVACATYKDVVQPIQLPETSGVDVGNGIKVYAEIYPDEEVCEKRFGLNLIRAGILPVLVVIQNDGEKTVRVAATQTMLVGITENGTVMASPMLSVEQASARLKKAVEAGELVERAAKPSLLGSIAGALIGATYAILTGRNVGTYAGRGAAVGATVGILSSGTTTEASLGKELEEKLTQKSLAAKEITPGTLAYGLLLFPAEHLKTIQYRRLRLCLVVNGSSRYHCSKVPLNQGH